MLHTSAGELGLRLDSLLRGGILVEFRAFYNTSNTGLGRENYAMPSPHFSLSTVQQIAILDMCIWGWVGLVEKVGDNGLISVVREEQKKSRRKRARSFDLVHHI